MDHLKEYHRWIELAKGEDKDIEDELRAISQDEAKIEDAFYRDLAFGTGGLRGVIGAGTNRMNIYTVAKASQGLANYVVKKYPESERRIAVSRDSRIKSDIFAKTAASVFAANGIDVYVYEDIMPTPCLSFATRELRCAAGIMVTASHNPSKYNGYKVYGSDGCQITTEAAEEILTEIESLDIFKDVRIVEFTVSGTKNEAVDIEKAGEGVKRQGNIYYIGEKIYSTFIDNVKAQSVLGADDKVDRNVAIVYSPLNGTGLKPVTRALRESGYTNITVVKEQEAPDGNFPTCPYPNPEIKEAMALGMEYAKKEDADLLLATDPDCDRVGIAVKDNNGEYRLLSGNETGILLLDYIASQRQKNGTMPEDPVMVKTIVTMDMGERIAEHYGIRTVNVLTGFKFIGEQIGRLESEGHSDSYIFGFEESYGYLTGSYVRDKDAVDGAFMICEMFSYYKTKGLSLLDKLEELYRVYGYCLNTLHSYQFEGSAGFDKMQKIMQQFRADSYKAEIDGANQPDDRPMQHEAIALEKFGVKDIEKVLDYEPGLQGLPKSDVLKYLLKDHCSVVIRPSGTEPKLKAYISISAESREKAESIEKEIASQLEDRMK
ncbi:phospho-sugar mutase [Oribacterium sp. WCC10]|uniref:phospho-sugar mutase n=1 Tax=Oribacterium sp. WCC10 TaxID=1855343 RepID=UPI0008F26C1D|nr:phospho-sugar mutase [Oribacterium sp. WCC10]SFG34111.1 phosphoglucomutase [Oribacterium sp. WCC10]